MTLPSTAPFNTLDHQWKLERLPRTAAAVASTGTLTPATLGAAVEIFGQISYQTGPDMQHGLARAPGGRENFAEARIHTETKLELNDLVRVYYSASLYRTYVVDELISDHPFIQKTMGITRYEFSMKLLGGPAR